MEFSNTSPSTFNTLSKAISNRAESSGVETLVNLQLVIFRVDPTIFKALSTDFT